MGTDAMGKAQTTSADAFIAVALFIIVVMFFFSISGEQFGEKKARDLQASLAKLVSSLSATRNTSESLLLGTRVNEQRLQQLSSLEYQRLKDAIGTETDFCIHFEDEEGDVVEISDTVTGLGSSFVRIGDTLCGRQLSVAEKIICEEAENAGECGRVGEFGLTQQQCCVFAEVCCI